MVPFLLTQKQSNALTPQGCHNKPPQAQNFQTMEICPLQLSRPKVKVWLELQNPGKGLVLPIPASAGWWRPWAVLHGSNFCRYLCMATLSFSSMWLDKGSHLKTRANPVIQMFSSQGPKLSMFKKDPLPRGQVRGAQLGHSSAHC